LAHHVELSGASPTFGAALGGLSEETEARMSTHGAIFSIAGVLWMAGVFWQFKAKQFGVAWMHISVGALNIAIVAMYFAEVEPGFWRMP
jgi:hypothetical protein